jgi:hypothetical protein
MNLPLQFEIEAVLTHSARVTVFARQLVNEPFALSETARLGGLPIHAHLSMPRALNSDGSPRLDLFAFQLRTHSDLSALSVGQLVTLEQSSGD